MSDIKIINKIDNLIAQLNNGANNDIINGLNDEKLKILINKMFVGGVTVKACAYT